MLNLPTTKLTKSELNILKYICFQSKEVAEMLHVTIATVQAHKLHIFNKLCVNSATQALVKALRIGLITLDDIKDYE